MINICTYFDSNYLEKGLACYYSLLSLSAEFMLFVVCLDEKTYKIVSILPKIKAIRLQELEQFCPNLLEVKNERTAVEYYSTITPLLPLYIFNKFHVGLLFYSDADIAFWSDPTEMIEVMGSKSLMVVSHEFDPTIPQEKSYLINNGRFNVGILGYRNDGYCGSFLEYWKNSCLGCCKWTPIPGKFADQGYLDVLHEDHNKFNSIQCSHPGINLAPWNLEKHIVSEWVGRKRVDGKYNLICYHYHQFCITGLNSYYSSSYKCTESDLKIIYDPYFLLFKKVKQEI